jgi:hypothetical protein
MSDQKATRPMSAPTVVMVAVAVLLAIAYVWVIVQQAGRRDSPRADP